jgi:hypothetical protein
LDDGYIYARAAKGPMTGQSWWPTPGEWDNYLVAEIAYNPDDMWDWHFVYYAQVLSSYASTYFLGDTTNWGPYNHVSISTMCPNETSPIQRNDVLVDCTWIDTF